MNFLGYKTTKGLYLGKPEAEAEKQSILDYFEDYFDLEESISQGNFIITGRKGSGKSAYAVWMQQNALKCEDEYCSLVLKYEFDLEAIINAIPTSDVKYEALFEWIILVRLEKMMLDSGIGTYLNQGRALKKFYESNAGYVNIDKYSIVEIINNKEVNFAPLKSNFGFFNKLFGTKSIKAPFYQMITPLRDTVIQMLNMSIFKDAKFSVLFDDLDVKLKLSREQDKAMLLDLIRVARRYNNEYLQRTTAKVLIFLRDDISDRLSGADGDESKMFTSYVRCINWYEHDMAVKDEKQVLLRQFINKRLAIAFSRINYDYNKEDPWLSFVVETGDRKSSFKYILDHTFYLPRDLLTIFKDVASKNMKLPLSHTDVNTLLREYAPLRKNEIEDELCVAVEDSDKVKRIFKVLSKIGRDGDVTYERLMELLSDEELNTQFVPLMLDYSLLVPVDEYGHFFFSYREQSLTRDLADYTFTIPRFLKIMYR